MATKQQTYLRHQFETAGWRTIKLVDGEVCWPGGRNNKFSVRLQARPGSAGELDLIVEDFATEPSRIKRIPLRRSNS